MPSPISEPSPQSGLNEEIVARVTHPQVNGETELADIIDGTGESYLLSKVRDLLKEVAKAGGTSTHPALQRALESIARGSRSASKEVASLLLQNFRVQSTENITEKQKEMERVLGVLKEILEDAQKSIEETRDKAEKAFARQIFARPAGNGLNLDIVARVTHPQVDGVREFEEIIAHTGQTQLLCQVRDGLDLIVAKVQRGRNCRNLVVAEWVREIREKNKTASQFLSYLLLFRTPALLSAPTVEEKTIAMIETLERMKKILSEELTEAARPQTPDARPPTEDDAEEGVQTMEEAGVIKEPTVTVPTFTKLAPYVNDQLKAFLGLDANRNIRPEHVAELMNDSDGAKAVEETFPGQITQLVKNTITEVRGVQVPPATELTDAHKTAFSNFLVKLGRQLTSIIFDDRWPKELGLKPQSKKGFLAFAADQVKDVFLRHCPDLENTPELVRELFDQSKPEILNLLTTRLKEIAK